MLEYVETECEYQISWCCNKREHRNTYEEDKHLTQLESDKYLKSPKKCCILETKEAVRCKN